MTPDPSTVNNNNGAGSSSDMHHKMPGSTNAPAAQMHPQMSPGKDCPTCGDSTHNASPDKHPPFGQPGS